MSFTRAAASSGARSRVLLTEPVRSAKRIVSTRFSPSASVKSCSRKDAGIARRDGFDLLSRALNDPAPAVRAAAAAALARTAGESSVGRLVRALGDDDALVRRRAPKPSGRLGMQPSSPSSGLSPNRSWRPARSLRWSTWWQLERPRRFATTLERRHPERSTASTCGGGSESLPPTSAVCSLSR
jgi:HEAT repeats